MLVFDPHSFSKKSNIFLWGKKKERRKCEKWVLKCSLLKEEGRNSCEREETSAGDGKLLTKLKFKGRKFLMQFNSN